jgi:hypothetical protein
MVRLPASERHSEYNIEELMIRVPTGGEIPFAQAAQAVRGTSYTRISRNNGRRVLDATTDLVPGFGNASEVLASELVELNLSRLEGLAVLRVVNNAQLDGESVPRFPNTAVEIGGNQGDTLPLAACP